MTYSAREGIILTMMYGVSVPQIEQQHLDIQISAFIDENSSLSAFAQIDAINKKTEESKILMQYSPRMRRCFSMACQFLLGRDVFSAHAEMFSVLGKS